MTRGLAEQFEIVVARDGSLPLPPEVREALGLEPGDAFALTQNPLSLRLESERELRAEWEAGSLPEVWRQDFQTKPQARVEADGSLPIPPELLTLAAGDRVMLEVVTWGLCHEVYLYRLEP